MGFKPKPDSKNLLIRHLKVISYTGTVPMSKSLDIKAPPPKKNSSLWTAAFCRVPLSVSPRSRDSKRRPMCVCCWCFPRQDEHSKRSPRVNKAQNLSNWWFQPTPQKKMMEFVRLDHHPVPIGEVITAMFSTTNQVMARQEEPRPQDAPAGHELGLRTTCQ